MTPRLNARVLGNAYGLLSMDQLEWREMAEMVAYADVVIYSTIVFSMVVGTGTFFLAFILQEYFNFELIPSISYDIKYGFWFHMGLFIVHIVVFIVQLYVAIHLQKATDVDANPLYALRRAHIWLAVNIVIFVIRSVLVLYFPFFIIFCGIVGGTMMWIVHQFIKELQFLLTSTTVNLRRQRRRAR